MKVNRYNGNIMISPLEKDIQRLYYNGFKAKAIADKLSVSVSTVYNRLHRLRKYTDVKRWWDD